MGCHYSGDPSQQKLDVVAFRTVGVRCADCHGDPHGLRPGAACAGCHDTESFSKAAGGLGAGDNTGALPAQTPTPAPVPSPDGGPGEEAIFQGTPHGPADATPPASADRGSSSSNAGFFSKTSLISASAREKVSGVPRDVYHDAPPFALSGGHSRLECQRCHGGAGDLQGFGKVCDSCHRQDDAHAGSLGPLCGECHSVRAFAPARFTHTTTGFSLMGAHRMLACNRCHLAGNYMGMNGDCISCHLDDAVRAQNTAQMPHGGFAAQSCLDCHNQISWLIAPPLRRRF
jgi:hypothetical protein